MKVIAFLTDYAVVDRIIDHLKMYLYEPSLERMSADIGSFLRSN